MFNLSILPGTAFRQEAEQLGLTYQPWPPYYVLQTPTLDVEQMYRLMEEAQEAFGIEFDPLPPPRLDLFDEQGSPCRGWRVDLDAVAPEHSPDNSLRLTAPRQAPIGSVGHCPPQCRFIALFHAVASFGRLRRAATTDN